MIAVLARAPLARLTRTHRTRLAIVAWCALAVTAAFNAHAAGWVHGADHALVETYAALALPLIAYVMVGAVCGNRSLSGSTAPVVAFGASPAGAAMAIVAVAVGACGLFGASLAAVVALVAHGTADPPRTCDALTSAYAGALGGAAYGSWLSLGAAFGRRGGGRSAFLVLDWVLGTGSESAAAITPRAHLRNLLGGVPPMDLPERASATALVLLAIGCALLATARAAARRTGSGTQR
jgi:hypothetical protein